MSRGTKIGLAIAGGVLLLCCIAGIVAYVLINRFILQAVILDPQKAAAVGHEMVDYTLPDGYREQMATTILGMKLVVIGPVSHASDAPVIMLMQFPASLGTSQEELEKQMRQQWEQQGGQRYQNLHVVGTQQVTIRGQAVTLAVSEGESSQGQVVRQLTGVFAGKNERSVMLMMTGAKESWDQNLVDSFLASIR